MRIQKSKAAYGTLAATVFVLLAVGFYCASSKSVRRPNTSQLETQKGGANEDHKPQSTTVNEVTSQEDKSDAKNHEQRGCFARIRTGIGDWLSKLITDPIALFTLVLALVAIWQGWQMWRGFIAAHRPRLVVRQITYLAGDQHEIWGVKSPRIEFLLVNIGANPATVLKSHYRIFSRTVGEPLIEFEHANTIGSVTLNPGQRHLLTYFLDSEESGALTVVRDLVGRADDLDERFFRIVFAGYVQYRNSIGTIMETGFKRGWNLRAGVFEKIELDDYEYED